MKRRTFTIRSKEVIENLTSFLESLPLEPEIEVIVQEKKKDRSIEQNSLLWVWITIIADEMGLTKEDVHNDLKRRLLVPIFERDEPAFAEMMQSIRKVYTVGHKVEAQKMFDHIVRMTSTTGATVKQFTEYLKDIEKDMTGKGIVLPHPEDRYYSAMGMKEY